MPSSNPSELLPRRLRQLGALASDPRGVVRSVLTSSQAFPADADLALQSGQVSFLAAGWACSLAVLADGRRQIISLILPGDVLGGVDTASSRPTRTFRSVTTVQLCDATRLLERDADGRLRHPDVHDAIVALQRQMQSYVYNQVVRLGALSAYERVGELFLELFKRLSRVGLTNGDQFLMPLTQERLGEMLGLSETHVNRTVRQLRQDGLLTVGPGWFALPDRTRLEACLGCSQSTSTET